MAGHIANETGWKNILIPKPGGLVKILAEKLPVVQNKRK